MISTQVCIVGGGLAGLVSAIHLAQQNIEVVLFEKHTYPRHKVCGEYISKEILPYLNSLDISLFKHQAVDITHLKLSHQSGQSLEQKLPLGGIGISRYEIDQLLAQKAKAEGVNIIHDEVLETTFEEKYFFVQSKNHKLKSDFVIAAHGKRSGFDKTLSRNFIQQKTPWIGIKAHYKTENFDENFVGLHNFKGGYCGLSMVENRHINLCYLVHQNEFKKYKSIEKFNQNGLTQNPHLKNFLSQSEPVFEKHLSISQISFQNKPTVQNHILFAGDAAGLIHPLCGNGMAMAIHSAKLLSEQILKFYRNEKISRTQVENNYQNLWHQTFNKRLIYGKMIQNILLKPQLSSNLIKLVSKSPFILKQIIKQTHGKPLQN
ncbi:NAD(P)/FAD-dependent oxidoreductase [Flavobacteriaceae bacterium 14752]|uniref:NAD(P)/FAD-dependent oxidoreductase n=1 Tax=Mesohalobacter salilacus TaxID=2491711 RepID=UPI000F63411C|nr:NAD(P)/FAD-dependent oxidoreductase [Flavobacteriaceae bacterium 14752]